MDKEEKIKKEKGHVDEGLFGFGKKKDTDKDKNKDKGKGKDKDKHKVRACRRATLIIYVSPCAVLFLRGAG